MFALAINGSPRKGGNTELLLNAVLEPLSAAGWDTELFQLGGKAIQGCQACFTCFEKQNKSCAMKRDCFNEVFEKIIRADAILIGSPTYYSDVTAETKALLDRAGFVGGANGGLLRGKIGAAVIAVRRGGGTHAFDTINHMYLISQMIVPGSLYWNLGYGREKGEVKQDEEGLENMRNLGKTIAVLGKAIKPVVDDFPKEEE